MSTSDAGGAGSNDSNATRRQSKRPKCNNSFILSFLFLAFRFVFGDFRVFATFCFLVKCMLGWEGLMVLLSFVS